jgi:predicted acyltransferase
MTTVTEVEKQQQRLMSIDALRGFDMFWIVGGGWIFRSLDDIFANDFTVAIKSQLRHAAWEGMTFEDMIMPLFLFIVGCAIPLSLQKRMNQGQGKKVIYGHLVRRVVILWFLGMIIQGRLLTFELDQLRLFSNTLQAIAVGYFFACVFFMHFKIKTQVFIAAGLLIAYWLVMSFVPVPGYGAGVLAPEGNLAIYIDQIILRGFGDGKSYTWILSSMGFVASVMFGVFAGVILKSSKTELRKFTMLVAVGVGMIIAAFIWASFFPIIKHLWTSSFALLAGGISFLLLALFYYVIDVKGYRKWAFLFIILGLNAIAVYTAGSLFDFRLIADIFTKGLAQYTGEWQSLIRATAGFGIFWFVFYYLYKNRTFVKI